MNYVQTNSRVRIAIYDLNPRGSKTIVLVHGWPLSHRIFEYQEELLVRHDYRVISLDLRGFGASDKPASGYSYDQLSDDLYNVIRTLGLRSFTLAGFSMGGAICMRYMGRHAGFGVKKLILLAAAAPSFTRRPDFPYGVTRESVDELIEKARLDRPQLNREFAGDMLFYREHSNALKDWFSRIGDEAGMIATIQTAVSLRDEDCREDMKKIRVRTGIFHGKRDKVVPYELAKVQHEGISGSVLFPFENSGHAIFYDELAAFNETFLAFLDK